MILRAGQKVLITTNIPVDYILEKVVHRGNMCQDTQVLTYSHSVVSITANEHKPN